MNFTLEKIQKKVGGEQKKITEGQRYDKRVTLITPEIGLKHCKATSFDMEEDTSHGDEFHSQSSSVRAALHLDGPVLPTG